MGNLNRSGYGVRLWSAKDRAKARAAWLSSLNTAARKRSR